MESAIYLDSNGTTPISIEVQQAITEALSSLWGNVSSENCYGVEARKSVNQAREHVAHMINAKPSEIIFMSGGTEANNTVLNTFASHENLSKARAKGEGDELRNLPHIITSAIEHDSIRKPLERIAADGLASVTFVPIDHNTHAVSVDNVMNALTPNTVLVSIMLANNETGVLQPVQEIAAAIRRHNQSAPNHVYIHTDAAQAVGKLPVDVCNLDVDYLTIAGHKFYGPRIGALYVRGLGIDDKVPLRPMMLGGGQERSYRAGTENTAMIVGFGKACELVSININLYYSHMLRLRDQLEIQLTKKFGCENVSFNGRSENSKRLPNTCNFSVVGRLFNGKKVLKYCKHVIASVGAACHSNCEVNQVSSVLVASGISQHVAANAIRISLGRETVGEDILIVVEDIWNAVQLIKQQEI